jgi:hypothetical protein
MGHLTDEALFGTTVPLRWAPLCQLIAALDALVTEQGEGPPTPALRARAQALREALVAQAAQLAEETPAVLRADTAEHRRWFTEAVLLWTRFGASGGRILVDTLGSTTLRHFVPDFPDSDPDRERVRAALCRTFGWTAPELARLEHSLLTRTSNLAVKNAIAAWLADHLDAEPADRQRRIAVLASRIYGPLPLRPGDVDLVLTSTSILFCFPFEGSALVRPDLATRPAHERAALGAFVEKIQKYKNSFDTIRFPAFGVYDRAAVDPALIATLTAAARAQPGLERVNEEVISETMATMVTIVPSLDAERFLVHDIWGHGWEESLCDFEWTYQQLLDLRAPLGPTTGARWSPATLAAAFVVSDDRVTLDRQALGACLTADLRGRITIGLNVVLAECLADLVEHKYVRQRTADAPELPSSSLLPQAPLKLDLSLRDTQMLLKAAHRTYRRLFEKAEDRAQLVEALVAGGLPPEGLAAAVEEAVRLAAENFRSALGTDVTAMVPQGDSLAVDLAQRVALGIVSLDAAIDRYLADGEAGCAPGPRWHCPRASIDLLVLLLAWFYEQDRSVNFWHLDELVRGDLAATMDRFQQELRAVLAP